MRRSSLCLLLLGVGLLGLSCAGRFKLDEGSFGSSTAYPCSQGSLAQTNAIEVTSFDGQLNQLWLRKVYGRPAGPLAIHYGLVMYPETKKRIFFYDLTTGSKEGLLRAKGSPLTGMAVADSIGLLALAPRKSLVRAYNLMDHKRIWEQPLKDALPGPIIVDNRLLVSSREGTLFALDVESGEVEWSYTADSRLSASASFGRGRLYQPVDDGSIQVLEAEDGQVVAQIQLDGPAVSPVAVADLLYVADMPGRVYALDPNDHSLIWKVEIGGPTWSSPAVAHGRVLVGHSGGEVVALEARTGQELWRYETGEVIKSGVLALGDFAVVGTMRGKILVLDAASGALVDSTTVHGGVAQKPVSDGGRLVVATETGRIYCFGAADEPADYSPERLSAKN